MTSFTRSLAATAAFALTLGTAQADHHLSVTYEGKSGPGAGKHIVLLGGDEEYRSEEALPMLGKVLAEHHGLSAPSSSRSTTAATSILTTRRVSPIRKPSTALTSSSWHCVSATGRTKT